MSNKLLDIVLFSSPVLLKNCEWIQEKITFKQESSLPYTLHREPSVLLSRSKLRFWVPVVLTLFNMQGFTAAASARMAQLTTTMTETSTESYYASTEIQSHKLKILSASFSDNFQSRLKSLPPYNRNSKEATASYANFFDTFGTHYVRMYDSSSN